jgi:hypothetical protein
VAYRGFAPRLQWRDRAGLSPVLPRLYLAEPTVFASVTFYDLAVREINFSLAVFLAACLVLVSSCGPPPANGGRSATRLVVTQDYGRSELLAFNGGPFRGSVSDMLGLAHARVDASQKALVSINDQTEGAGRAWFGYINGVAVSQPLAAQRVEPGDSVQLDLRHTTPPVPSAGIVGSYPQPFVGGFGGKRVPVRLECQNDGALPCQTVRASLLREGVALSEAPSGTAAGPEVLRVVVGRWQQVSHLQSVGVLARGPTASGVFASIDRVGGLELYDRNANPVQALSSQAGLVCVTQLPGEGPVWVVTAGSDPGLDAAAKAVNETTLAGAYAVAVTPNALLRLPL